MNLMRIVRQGPRYFAIALMAGMVGAGCGGVRTAKTNEGLTKSKLRENANRTEISKTIANLRSKHGQIPFGISAENFLENIGRMHALLAEWNPIGTSSNELVYLLGLPTEPLSRRNPNPNCMGYAVDSGLKGAVWYFDLENQKVMRMEVKAID